MTLANQPQNGIKVFLARLSARKKRERKKRVTRKGAEVMESGAETMERSDGGKPKRAKREEIGI